MSHWPIAVVDDQAPLVGYGRPGNENSGDCTAETTAVDYDGGRLQGYSALAGDRTGLPAAAVVRLGPMYERD